MYFTDEKDYIMRMIKEMVRVLFSLIFGKKYVSVELENKYEVSGKNLKDFLDMIDSGQINEAENILLDSIGSWIALITISSSSRRSLKSLQCEEANSYILSMSTAPVISLLLMITRIFVPSSSTAKRSSSNSLSGSFLRIESVASNLTSSIILSSLPASKIWIFSTS